MTTREEKKRRLSLVRYTVPERVQKGLAACTSWFQMARSRTLLKIWEGRSVEKLLTDIKDPAPLKRFLAAEILGMLHDEKAVPHLVQALEDEEGFVRKASAGALRKIGAPAIEPLLQVLTHEKDHVLLSAIAVLGNIGNMQAVEPLLGMLEHEHWQIRRATAVALGQIGDYREVKPLIETLKDGYWSKRKAIADGLDQLTDTQDLSLFIEGLWDEDWFVRKTALKVLKRRGIPAIKALIHAFGTSKSTERKAIAATLGKMGLTAIKPLFQALLTTKRDVRKGVLESFGQIFEGNIDTNDDWRVRQAAANALGEIGDPQAVEQLILTLQDANWPVRATASIAKALGRMNDERALEPLIHTLGRNQWFIRRSAVQALQQIGKPSLEPLIKALEDQDWLVRRSVIPPLKHVCGLIETVVFGERTFKEIDPLTTWHNPDISTLQVPLSSLHTIIIDVANHHFHELERFMTYAVNHIGQKRLKKHVVVHLYGDAEDLHRNLFNALHNLCKRVECHEI